MASQKDESHRTSDMEPHRTSGIEPPSATTNLMSALSADKYLGMTLKDRYLIEKQLGQGAIGIVFLAHDLQLLSKPVVIKVLFSEVGKTDDENRLMQKFRQQIEALSYIEHPGIVGALDAGQMPDGHPYLVMQFVNGVNLRSVMHPDDMPLSRIASIIKQISRALSAAHDKGICHGDLKPENIMLQDFGGGEEVIKLIDFGIVKITGSQVSSLTEGTKGAGTIAYMAPEQLLGNPSALSDIYALGVITYEMITGRRPFNSDSPSQLFELQKAGWKVKPKDLCPNLPEAAQEVILRALSFDQNDRFSRVRQYGEQLSQALTGVVEKGTSTLGLKKDTALEIARETFQMPPAVNPSREQDAERVAILYKRNAQPDEQLLKLLEQQLLANGYKVFIDRHLTIGVEWAQEIERQVSSADAVITLLSSASVASEMLAYEVQIAQEAAQKRQGKPRLLPVRVNYEGPLPDPLGAILDPLQYALWNDPEDNARLVAEMLLSLQSPPPKPVLQQPKRESVGGATPLDSQFYIVRPTDEEFHAAIANHDSLVLVKGARQMGKTSLLARGLQQAREAGAKVILTDFQKLNAAHLETIETFLQTLADLIADQLDLDVLPDQVWNPRRGPSMNFERYIRREVLGKISEPVVWGLDEVDRLFARSYGNEVFGLFRAWHNERSLNPTGPWQRLTMAIVYATEAHLFITDINQSPFNVGTRLVLEDFTFEQVAELNRRYNSPLQSTSEVARFFRLVGGHPYLVRRSLHEMVTHNRKLADFEAIADRDDGPLGDHLRRILVLLAQDSALYGVVQEVLKGRPCPSNESFYRLQSAGIIAGDSARDARPRCQLYATYLERFLL